MKSQQEIFDTVVRHLHNQKVPAKNYGGNCLYRMEDGKMCAVGCLIEDHAYNPDMEGMGMYGLIDQMKTGPVTTNPLYIALTNSDLPTDLNSLDLMRELQYAHDSLLGLVSEDRFNEKLKEIAEKFYLEWRGE